MHTYKYTHVNNDMIKRKTAYNLIQGSDQDAKDRKYGSKHIEMDIVIGVEKDAKNHRNL